MINRNNSKLETTTLLLSSFLDFTRVFYLERTGRKFELSEPIGRRSHYLDIADALTDVANGKIKKLLIRVPPRYGKTELCIHFIAWTIAKYPDSNYIYTSYAHMLAKKQTQTVRSIIQLPLYRHHFGVKISDETSAKDNFETNYGGSVYAAGTGGSITGRGAGIANCDRFGGCPIIDDNQKPDEATSEVSRENAKEWYYNTLQSRTNSANTPTIFIGQQTHEDDLGENLKKTGEWTCLIIPAIDKAGNALHPKMHDIQTLRKMQKESPYNFTLQYMQESVPAGGGIFKSDWFVKLEEEPKILATFITCDTAETDKDYNDATAFSFWGLYKIEQFGIETDTYGLHCINCIEIRVEPKDLENELASFYRSCMSHKVKPKAIAIEKKSTGVTLASTLKTIQGLKVIEIERTRSSGNKTSRYLEIQTYIAQYRISLPIQGLHTHGFIEHCRKITANNSHAHDDIADTMYDAIKLALIDEVILKRYDNTDYNSIGRDLLSGYNKINRLKKDAYS